MVKNYNFITISNELQKTFPDFMGLLHVDNSGRLISYICSKRCAGEHDLNDFKKIAKLVSKRFPLDDIEKLSGGLEATINVFKSRIVYVRRLQEKILVIILPKTNQVTLDKLYALLSINGSASNNEKKSNAKQNYYDNSSQLKRVSSEITEFQKKYSKLLIPKKIVKLRFRTRS